MKQTNKQTKQELSKPRALPLGPPPGLIPRLLGPHHQGWSWTPRRHFARYARYTLLSHIFQWCFLKNLNPPGWSSGGTRNFFFGGAIEGAKCDSEWAKIHAKLCQKWLILAIFCSDWGQVGEQSLQRGDPPPWCRHWADPEHGCHLHLQTSCLTLFIPVHDTKYLVVGRWGPGQLKNFGVKLFFSFLTLYVTA